MSTEVREAFADLKTTIVGLANETAGDARESLLDIAARGEAVLVEIAEGKYQGKPELLDEAQHNLKIAATAALASTGWEGRERLSAMLTAGISTVFKVAVALA